MYEQSVLVDMSWRTNESLFPRFYCTECGTIGNCWERMLCTECLDKQRKVDDEKQV